MKESKKEGIMRHLSLAANLLPYFWVKRLAAAC
jgi:hypothetical protein